MKMKRRKNEVTGFAIVNGLYYKATSPDMLMLSFMSVTQDSMSVIPTLQAKYLQFLLTISSYVKYFRSFPCPFSPIYSSLQFCSLRF